MNEVLPNDIQIHIGKMLEESVEIMKEMLSSNPKNEEVSAIDRFLIEEYIVVKTGYIEKIKNLTLTHDDVEKMKSEQQDINVNMQLGLPLN